MGTFTNQVGFVLGAGIVKNGIGDWTLEYQTPLNTDNNLVVLTIQDQGGSGQRENITGESVDDTHIRVRTFQAASAKDQHFWIEIKAIG